MTRQQLRPFYTPEQLAAIYDHQYDHTRWGDHIERVNATTKLLDSFALTVGAETVADLSCGDGAVISNSRHPWLEVEFGDFTTTGRIEDALPNLHHVDMYVCTETLEHIEDPDWLLKTIRLHADYMILSTPDSAWDEGNPEHYWAWSSDDVREMLDSAGWDDCSVELFTPTNPYYTFQMWTCQ